MISFRQFLFLIENRLEFIEGLYKDKKLHDPDFDLPISSRESENPTNAEIIATIAQYDPTKNYQFTQ
jgi:hypothetical protein